MAKMNRRIAMAYELRNSRRDGVRSCFACRNSCRSAEQKVELVAGPATASAITPLNPYPANGALCRRRVCA
jgi:hypothetical protein